MRKSLFTEPFDLDIRLEDASIDPDVGPTRRAIAALSIRCPVEDAYYSVRELRGAAPRSMQGSSAASGSCPVCSPTPATIISAASTTRSPGRRRRDARRPRMVGDAAPRARSRRAVCKRGQDPAVRHAAALRRGRAGRPGAGRRPCLPARRVMVDPVSPGVATIVQELSRGS